MICKTLMLFSLLKCDLDSNNVMCKSKVTYISVEWSLAMGLALKKLSELVKFGDVPNNKPKLTSETNTEQIPSPYSCKLYLITLYFTFFLTFKLLCDSRDQ